MFEALLRKAPAIADRFANRSMAVLASVAGAKIAPPWLAALGVKQVGARSAGNPHAACDVEGTGNVARSSGLPARQPSTLPPRPRPGAQRIDGRTIDVDDDHLQVGWCGPTQPLVAGGMDHSVAGEPTEPCGSFFMVGPLSSTTRSKASTAACHSSRSCSAL